MSWYQGTTGGAFPAYYLQPQGAHPVTVTMPDGRTYEFDVTVSPASQALVEIEAATVSFEPRQGTTKGLATLTPVGGGDVLVPGLGSIQLFGYYGGVFDPQQYLLTLADGRSFVIDKDRGLQSLTDPNGNTLSVSAAGITSSSGKGIAFTRSGNVITAITDPMGHSVTYGYDGSGDLASVTDRDTNTTSFTYFSDPQQYPPQVRHLLDGIHDPLGHTPIKNTYYDDGRIESHTDAYGHTITYQHNVAARQETVTDREGGVRVLDFDERGNVIRETDPNSKVVERTFDAHNNRTSETAPHDQGDGSMGVTTYVYDLATDTLTSVTDPESHTTEYTYNARQQPLTVKDPRGNYTINEYDPQGNLTATRVAKTPTDVALSKTTYSYWPNGSVKTQTQEVDGAWLVTQYEYTGSDLTRQTDPSGHATNYTYDGNGNARPSRPRGRSAREGRRR